jgi:uncharacterized membrane protein
VATAVLGIWEGAAGNRLLIIVATLLYLLGVQLPTAAINVPLNNRLQILSVDTMSEPTRTRARGDFESRWNRSNALRAACAGVASFLLIVAVARA